MGKTREMIREFSLAFGRPVNDRPTTPSVTDRLLLGKLLLEETLEYIEKGLGLNLKVERHHASFDDRAGAKSAILLRADKIQLWHCEGQRYNPIEAADGLGDVNVIIHFNALWEGIDLDAVTQEIHRSNMSKLGKDGKPIINREYDCESCNGRGVELMGHEYEPETCRECEGSGKTLLDPTRPAGKILKGPNYSPPNLLPILGIVPHEEEE